MVDMFEQKKKEWETKGYEVKIHTILGVQAVTAIKGDECNLWNYERFIT